MDVRTELSLINKHFKRYQNVANLSVVWYEFIPLGDLPATESVYDDVYDEGIRGTGGKKYKNGVVLPAMLITEVEDEKRAIADGRKPTQNINMFVTMKDMRDVGITDPWEYQARLNDMFVYDGRYYNVSAYKVRGAVKDEVFALITGYETYVDEELVNDPGPPALGISTLPWPSNLPNLG